MVYFVGAGSGAVDLITVRGARLLGQADLVIYAGSLVNPELLTYTRPDCRIYNSASLTLEEVVDLIEEAEAQGLMTVRLHTGDPSIYGAIKEQFDQLRDRGIDYELCPGVSSFCGAAAALKVQLTQPELSQTVIIGRAAGRTPVGPGEDLVSLASHRATMVLFLSVGLSQKVQADLLAGGYPPDTPVAVVYKATWPEEKIIRCNLDQLAQSVEDQGIRRTALIIVGDCLADREPGERSRSRLYAPDFATEFRPAKPETGSGSANSKLGGLVEPKPIDQTKPEGQS